MTHYVADPSGVRYLRGVLTGTYSHVLVAVIGVIDMFYVPQISIHWTTASADASRRPRKTSYDG